MGESREGRAEAGPENATRLSMGLCQRAASPTTSLRPWAGARRPGILESMPRHPRGPWISNAIPCPLDESDPIRRAVSAACSSVRDSGCRPLGYPAADVARQLPTVDQSALLPAREKSPLERPLAAIHAARSIDAHRVVPQRRRRKDRFRTAKAKFKRCGHGSFAPQ